MFVCNRYFPKKLKRVELIFYKLKLLFMTKLANDVNSIIYVINPISILFLSVTVALYKDKKLRVN
jgi:hypothetical protein